jgi:beta-galactosidase
LWLKERYVTVNKLNFDWGTAFWSQNYYYFDEILPPRRAASFPNPTQQLDWARFSSDALRATSTPSARRSTSTARAFPSRPTTYMLTQPNKGMDVSTWDVDFVSNDHYRIYSEPDERDELSFAASLTGGVAGGKPWWLMEHSTSAVNWQTVNIARKRGEMATDALTLFPVASVPSWSREVPLGDGASRWGGAA